MIYVCCLFSSPFLFVFHNDRVTCHTGADDNLGIDSRHRDGARFSIWGFMKK